MHSKCVHLKALSNSEFGYIFVSHKISEFQILTRMEHPSR